MVQLTSSAALPRLQEKRLSVRLVWPFVRALGVDRPSVEAFARAGVRPADLVNLETRIPHRLLMDVLSGYVARTGDLTVGLRAAESLEPGDLETLEFAARSCANLREAIKCSARYMHLMNEAAEVSLVEDGAEALWRFRTTDGVPQAPPANDFIVGGAAVHARRYVGAMLTALEVHFVHPAPADTVPYTTFFRAKLRFGMPHNGFVLSRTHLELPMVRAEPAIQAAFETRARELSERLGAGIRQQVTDLIVIQLRTGRISMRSLARGLSMSVATLRRRLDDEGTKFSEIVDDVRRALAETHLRNRRMSISEVAFLLGFAHVPAFYGAFRRWTGTTPTEYRERVEGAESTDASGALRPSGASSR
jgi:AraC-like DNA-binding protein